MRELAYIYATARSYMCIASDAPRGRCPGLCAQALGIPSLDVSSLYFFARSLTFLLPYPVFDN